MGVTKTDFMRGMQCPRMLWLDRHRPEFRVIPPEVQELLDRGNEFGDRAMGMFGPFVETTVRREDGRLNISAMLKKTQELLREGTPVICEAAFSHYNNYCALDILRRTENGFSMYEVKNSDEVKEQFVKDVAFQRYVVTKCGLPVRSCFVVLPGNGEEYRVEDVTPQARQLYRWVDENIWRLGKVKFSKEEVFVQVGPQCEEPYRCWYYDYCHGEK